MNAKEYLNQIRKLDKLIDNKLTEVEHWRAVASGITINSDGEKVQASSSKQKMADAVCRYLTMEQEINEAIDQLVNIRQDIITTIEQLAVVEYDVLHKIYVQGMEFFEVAESCGKSYSWVTTINGNGLSNVQKILDERKKNEDKTR